MLSVTCNISIFYCRNNIIYGVGNTRVVLYKRNTSKRKYTIFY